MELTCALFKVRQLMPEVADLNKPVVVPAKITLGLVGSFRMTCVRRDVFGIPSNFFHMSPRFVLA